MSTELIPSAQGNEQVNQLLAVSTSSGFLPRLQLFGANSAAVKEEKIGMGHYGLVRSKDVIEDLGKEVELLNIAGRPKAMKWDSAQGTVISVYNPAHGDFKKFQELSAVKDSGCSYGPEFLIWLPEQDAFATFYLNNPTARREAPVLAGLLAKGVVLTAKLIKNARFMWHGPVVSALPTPSWSIPDIKAIEEEREKFLNPKVSEVETAEPESRAR